MQTWVYRVAHNVGASHVVRSRRHASHLVDLDTVEAEIPAAPDDRLSTAILLDLIRRLKPQDRQIILLYLEGESAESIAAITGFSTANVATKIHRIKKLLWRHYQEGNNDAA